MKKITIEVTEEQHKKILALITPKEEPFDFRSITSLEKACKRLGYNHPLVKELNSLLLPEGVNVSDDIIAYMQLKVIRQAIVGDWNADLKNTDQHKWGPWFKVFPSGFRFADSCYLYDFTYSRLGSHLCFETKGQSNFAGKQFESYYKRFLM